MFADIAKEVPTYAGHFVGANGQLAAYVVDPSDFGRAQGAIQQRLASGAMKLPPSIRGNAVSILKGDFTFQQLSDWRDTVYFEILGKFPGIVTDDLDEARNRVTIGIQPGNESSKASVLKRLASLGVPAAAIQFEVESGPTPAMRSAMFAPPSSLLSRSDTIVGGLRILWTHALDGPGHGYLCTIGFTVTLSGGSAIPWGTQGFISAAHCSGSMWSTDANRDHYYQPDSSVRGSIGYEGYDPTAGTCPILWPCDNYRFSDANLIIRESGDYRTGVLARPNERVSGRAGNTNLSTSAPYLYVYATTDSPLANQIIDKIGATSGWTTGTVTRTCVDYVPGFGMRNDMVRCAYKTSLHTEGGDSGAPVFTWDGMDGVVANGILFAQSDSHSSGWFSKWQYVYSELTGAPTVATSFTVTAGITISGTPGLSGSLSGGSPVLSWAPVSASGTTSQTSYVINRATWDADRGTYIDNGPEVTVTSTSFTDVSTYIPVDTYLGTTHPGTCDNSWISYRIRAYNAGKYADSQTIYFRGAASATGCTGDNQSRLRHATDDLMLRR